MNILITNDDGYKAKGIHVLSEIMCQFGNVTVIAPKKHQSGMGMAVSLGLKQIAYKELPDEKPGKWSYLDATPASCVKFGLNVPFLDRFPDVVVWYKPWIQRSHRSMLFRDSRSCGGSCPEWNPSHRRFPGHIEPGCGLQRSEAVLS